MTGLTIKIGEHLTQEQYAQLAPMMREKVKDKPGARTEEREKIPAGGYA